MQENTERIADLIRQGKKLEAIKLLRETTGVGLKEAKDAVERLSTGLDDPEPPPATPPSGTGETLPSDILELARDGKKIEAIKRLRERTGLSLKEAKEQVDQAIGGGSGGSGCAGVVLLFLMTTAGLLAVLMLGSGAL